MSAATPGWRPRNSSRTPCGGRRDRNPRNVIALSRPYCHALRGVGRPVVRSSTRARPTPRSTGSHLRTSCWKTVRRQGVPVRRTARQRPPRPQARDRAAGENVSGRRVNHSAAPNIPPTAALVRGMATPWIPASTMSPSSDRSSATSPSANCGASSVAVAAAVKSGRAKRTDDESVERFAASICSAPAPPAQGRASEAPRRSRWPPQPRRSDQPASRNPAQRRTPRRTPCPRCRPSRHRGQRRSPKPG